MRRGPVPCPSPSRRRRSVLGVTATLAALTVAVAPAAVAAPTAPALLTGRTVVAGPGTVAGDAVVTGRLPERPLRVEVNLTPAHPAALAAELAALYDPNSPEYRHWLAPGVFAARYAPTATAVAAVDRYLTGAGLRVVPSGSPFLAAAVGGSDTVAAAFATSLQTERDPSGSTFWTTASASSVPSAVAASVSGVVGLSDTVRIRPERARVPAGHATPRYGAGPAASGLTPDQIVGLYGEGSTTHAGAGETSAVFELSSYDPADITHWTRHFYGPAFTAPLTNRNVDGGSVTPVCPQGDTCTPGPDYSGDDEVTADIEMQLSVAPHLASLLVYDAPNDTTGQTTIDEYARIAADDRAATLSVSWGLCEPDIGLPVAAAENISFEQMAAQGQSVTAAAGDSGAYDCLGDNLGHNKVVAVDDPASQPWVLGVGGTSFSGYDPRGNEHPTYPAGLESVWNPLQLCDPPPQTLTGGLAGCKTYGAGGGGISSFWGRPASQAGPGVDNRYTQTSPSCELAATGQACREVPDVSADADEYSGYADYCVGYPGSNSACRAFYPPWAPAGGTSLSSPLWASVLADNVAAHGRRLGDPAALLYGLATKPDHIHDITGRDQTDHTNGLYPTTPDYDLATGLGSPVIAALVAAD